MKKRRFLSMLLCICMVMSLFVGITGTASADSGTFIHVVQNGEYLLRICKSYGLDYYQCRNAIMALNGFTSEAQLNALTVGQKIELPESNAVAAGIKTNTTVTTTTTTTIGGTTTSTTTTTTTGSGLSNGDTIAYYLIPYTMRQGDSIASVCNQLGTSYSQYAELIKGINGIKNLNLVWAGKLVYFPTNKAPSSGSYYAVVAHTVLSGEIMTNICKNFGTSYLSNYTMISGMNKGKNLNYIQAGSIVYVPALSSAINGNGGNNGNNGNNNNNSNNNNNNINSGYKITFAEEKGGEPYATVNSARVVAAQAGSYVTIMPNAKYGYAQETVSVAYVSGGAAVKVDANCFTMPAADVVVTIKYAAGKIISHSATAGGDCSTYVDGVSVGSAIFGKTVTVIPEPDNGYAAESVVYSYTDYTSGTPVIVTKEVKKTDGVYSFTMPDAKVSVSATFKKVTTWKINTYDMISHGSVLYKIDGYAVSRASEGQTVCIEPVAETGYRGRKMTVKASNGADIKVTMDEKGAKGYFTMPNCAVTVTVTFTDFTRYKITAYASTDGVPSNAGGFVRCFVNGVETPYAQEGDEVKIVADCYAGYSQDLNDTVLKLTNNSAVVNTIDLAKNTFIMPAADVTLKVEFASGAHAINKANVTNGAYSFAVRENVPVTSAQENEMVAIVLNPVMGYEVKEDELAVTFTSYDPGTGKYSAEKYTVANGKIQKSGDRYFFTMPNFDVFVSAGFIAAKTFPIELTGITDEAIVKFMVEGVAVDNCVPRWTVKLDIQLKPGQTGVKKVTVNGNEIEADSDGVYSFEMPNKKATVDITLENATVFEINHSISTKGEVFIDAPIVSKFEAEYEDTVDFHVTPKSGYHITSVTVLYNDLEEHDAECFKEEAGGIKYYRFMMPACDVSIKVEYALDPLKLTKKVTLENGTFTMTAGDNVDANEACEGEVVKVFPTPVTGYKVDKVTFKPDGGTSTDATKSADGSYWFFTMPGKDTEVEVTFVEAIYKLTAKAIDATILGTVKIDDGSNNDTTTTDHDAFIEPKYNANIAVTVTESNPTYYKVEKIIVNGEAYTTNPVSFQMPAADVVITVVFSGERYLVNAAHPAGVGVDLSALPQDEYGFRATAGTTVNYNITKIDPGAVVKKIEILDSTNTVIPDANIGHVFNETTGKGQFIMPDEDVTVSVAAVEYKAAAQSNGYGKISLTEDYTSGQSEVITQEKATPGTPNVYIVVEPAANCQLLISDITIYDYLGNDITAACGLVEDGTTGNFKFEMPECSVTVRANFSPVNYYDVVVAKATENTVKGFAVNGQWVSTEFGGSVKVAAGHSAEFMVVLESGLKVKNVDAKWFGGALFSATDAVDMGSNTYKFTFIMPDGEVTIDNLQTENITSADLTYQVTGSGFHGYLFFATPSNPVPDQEIATDIHTGETVTVKLKPSAGCKLDKDSIKVLDKFGNTSGIVIKATDLTDVGNGEFTFTFNMPEFDTMVTAEFADENAYKVSFKNIPSAEQIQYIRLTDSVGGTEYIDAAHTFKWMHTGNVTMTIVLKEGLKLTSSAIPAFTGPAETMDGLNRVYTYTVNLTTDLGPTDLATCLKIDMA